MIRIRDKEEKPMPPIPAEGGLTCEEFQDRMAGLMGSDIRSHEHLRTCVRCNKLIDDLEYIVRIAEGLLPSYEPSDKVWQKITQSIHEPPEKNGGPNGLTHSSKP